MNKNLPRHFRLKCAVIIGLFYLLFTVQSSNTIKAQTVFDKDLNRSDEKIMSIENLTATTNGDTVLISWSTKNETGILGFNIYREVSGFRELLTTSPITGRSLLSSADFMTADEIYRWADKTRYGAAYYLESIDFEGNRTMYDPVFPTFQASISDYKSHSPTLSDLKNSQNRFEQKEYIYENDDFALSPSKQFEIASKPAVKISVNKDAWYYVSPESLQANGFDLNSNRNNWQLFVGGEEVPIKVNNNGSIEFFGRGADTLATDRQVYYLTNGTKGGMRLTSLKNGKLTGSFVTSYSATVERKENSIYLSSILNGDVGNWFGSVVTPSSETVQNLSINNIAPNTTARLRVKLQGLTNVAHSVRVRFNQTTLGQVTFSSMANREVEFTVPASALIEGENSVRLQGTASSSDVSITDKVTLSYSRLYKAVNNQIRFSVPANKPVKVSGFTNSAIAVYEIKNGTVGTQVAVTVSQTNGNYSFDLGGGQAREILATALSAGEQPVAVERNISSTLNAANNQADFVIIAPEIFQNQANSLAQLRQAQGLITKVVLTEDVADEFGYGILTAEAVKSFLQTAKNNWQLKPRYALLFGDSTFDPRSFMGQQNRNLIPTKLVDTEFMETSGDSWLADFNGDRIEDISIGRLPAGNLQEADILMQKIFRYELQPNRTEKTVIFPSDYGFEGYTQILQSQLPNDVNAVRIDRAAMSDAEMNNQIMNRLNQSPIITSYVGHGSTLMWAATSVFTINNAENLQNSELGFFLLTTCLNGYTHNVNSSSLSETIMMNPNGGAVVVWASSGTNYLDSQLLVSRDAIRMVFNGQNGPMRIGDIVRIAKQSTPDPDVRYNYLLLGDPTIHVK